MILDATRERNSGLCAMCARWNRELPIRRRRSEKIERKVNRQSTMLGISFLFLATLLFAGGVAVYRSPEIVLRWPVFAILVVFGALVGYSGIFFLVAPRIATRRGRTWSDLSERIGDEIPDQDEAEQSVPPKSDRVGG